MISATSAQWELLHPCTCPAGSFHLMLQAGQFRLICTCGVQTAPQPTAARALLAWGYSEERFAPCPTCHGGQAFQPQNPALQTTCPTCNGQQQHCTLCAERPENCECGGDAETQRPEPFPGGPAK